MPAREKFVLGTWQLSGDFLPFDQGEAVDLLSSAEEAGVHYYDTAAVYGGGAVETAIGRSLSPAARVITKVPSLIRAAPDAMLNSEACYPAPHLESSLDASSARLQRKPYVYLLHNWQDSWDYKETAPILDKLAELRAADRCSFIGISLPNDFKGKLDASVTNVIDYIEVAHNQFFHWLNESRWQALQANNVKVLIRSLFMQGILLKSSQQISKLSQGDKRIATANDYAPTVPMQPKEVIRDVLKGYDAQLVIGCSSAEQIKDNITFIGEAM